MKSLLLLPTLLLFLSGYTVFYITSAQPNTPSELKIEKLNSTYTSTLTSTVNVTWERTNPGGGGAFSTVGVGPTGIIIAASDLSGAYRSLDQGQSWDVIGAFRGLVDTHISGVGFDPTDPAILFLGSSKGIYRSIDSGTTVQKVLDDGYISDIQIAASNPQIGYATYHSVWNVADGQIYKTINGGLDWSRISNASLPDALHLLEIIIDPTDENRLYVFSGEGRFTCNVAVLFESTDGGISWAPISESLGQIMDIDLSPFDPKMLYLTT